jgi:type I restriction enzyme S subunit
MISNLSFPCPPVHEQKAIAAALSDADGVVAGLERVIAKKRLIKQGAMQDLLTARRRLPGFSGEWEVRPFAQIARIRNSKVQTLGNPVAQSCIELEQIEHETGRVLFWVDATARPTVKYQFEPGDVLFGRLRPYLRKFHRATVQGVCSTEIWPLMSQGIDSGFLYQVVQSSGFVAAACEAYGTHMPRADWGKLATFEVQVPVDPKEQVAIGEALNDMEKEIQTLESRLTKARAVKEGMMQNLLTGRVRLV